MVRVLWYLLLVRLEESRRSTAAGVWWIAKAKELLSYQGNSGKSAQTAPGKVPDMKPPLGQYDRRRIGPLVLELISSTN